LVREAVEQLLLPAECLLCRALLSFRDSARLVCDVCRHRWRPVRAPWCPRCGQPEPLFGACRLCAEWPAAFGRARSAVWLDGGADECSAFRVPSSAFERPLVLVDDVFTTGATLAEAARALDQAGARTVLAVTFGRAVVPDFT